MSGLNLELNPVLAPSPNFLIKCTPENEIQAVGPELSVFLVIDAKKGRDAKNIRSGEAAGDSLEFDG